MAQNKDQRPVRHVCFVGAGYVGGTTAVVLALKNPEIQFTVVDINSERIEAWNSTRIPVYEPGLFDILCRVSARHSNFIETTVGMQDTKHTVGNGSNDGDIFERKGNISGHLASGSDGYRAPNLFFRADIRDAIAAADMVFITVNTPSKNTSDGTLTWDLSHFESVLFTIAEVSSTDKIIVQKSTVPCGTAQRAAQMLKSKAKPGVSFTLLSSPEFLSQGSALKDLLQPWSVLIGNTEISTGNDSAPAALRALYEPWVPKDRILTMNAASSELVKIANNAMEAQRISSINSLSAICEVVGADVQDISRACGLNPRIGPHCLQAGVGFGGSCFEKDILGLVGLAETMSLPLVANYWRQVLLLNEFQISRVAAQICQLGSLSVGRKVAILGFAFKKDTGDARGSIARDVILALFRNNIMVVLHDGLVPKQDIMRELGFQQDSLKSSTFPEEVFRIYDTPYEMCRGVEVVVIMNDAQEYEELDWTRISAGMIGNKVIVDNRRTTDATKMKHFGFIVRQIGASNWLNGGEAI